MACIASKESESSNIVPWLCVRDCCEIFFMPAFRSDSQWKGLAWATSTNAIIYISFLNRRSVSESRPSASWSFQEPQRDSRTRENCCDNESSNRLSHQVIHVVPVWLCICLIFLRLHSPLDWTTSIVSGDKTSKSQCLSAFASVSVCVLCLCMSLCLSVCRSLARTLARLLACLLASSLTFSLSLSRLY